MDRQIWDHFLKKCKKGNTLPKVFAKLLSNKQRQTEQTTTHVTAKWSNTYEIP